MKEEELRHLLGAGLWSARLAANYYSGSGERGGQEVQQSIRCHLGPYTKHRDVCLLGLVRRVSQLTISTVLRKILKA
jgi:hypothetical protein